jgi:hypothetical protein
MSIARIATALTLAACGTIPAHAQESIGSTPGLSALRPGDTVVVTRASAPTLRGRLIAASEGELTIQNESGPRRIPVGAVARVWRDDSLWNGALIGAGVGAAAMGVMVSDCKRHDSECRNIATGIGLVVTGGMAAVGTLVDHFRRRLIYERPGLHASVRPVATGRAAGVTVRLRF